MAKYGPFPTHDAQERPNLILTSAMPGRRESGRWWGILYHRFLRRGFTQGIWDMCSFYITRNGELLIIIHVNDTRGLSTHKWLQVEFLAAWRTEPPREAQRLRVHR